MLMQEKKQDFLLADRFDKVIVRANSHGIVFFAKPGNDQQQRTMFENWRYYTPNDVAFAAFMSANGQNIHQFPPNTVRYEESSFQVGEDVSILGKIHEYSLNGFEIPE